MSQRRDALPHPWDFTSAAWMVAVSYRGTTWGQVACQAARRRARPAWAHAVAVVSP